MLGRVSLRFNRMRPEHSGIGFSSVAFFGLVVVTAVAACSSSSPPPKAPPGLTCSAPGEATPGPADTHCVGQPVQDVNQASCMNYDASSACGDDGGAPGGDGGPAGDDSGAGDGGGAGDDGGAAATANECDYGATMFGPGSDGGGPLVVEGDDDDCKYHVSWTSSPICSSTLGVNFTVTVTYLGTDPPIPVTDIPATEGVLVEAFIPKTLDAACDTMFQHFSPTPFSPGHGLLQTSPGVYFGSVIFDQPGEWTLRFHIHEECSDLCANSPHGHAAFHINVP
jgi:hypothetical protein